MRRNTSRRMIRGTAGTAFIAALLLAAFPARGFEAGGGPETVVGNWPHVQLTVQTAIGRLNGDARELVFGWDENGNRYKGSELIWDLKGLTMGGITASAKIYKRYHVSFGYWGAINEGDGRMEDFDWFIPGGEWTDWSLSDVKVDQGSLIDLNSSIDAWRGHGVTLSGLVGYRRDIWSWRDYGIRHIYSTNPYSPYGFRDNVEEDPHTTGITYRQVIRIPYAGVQATGDFGPVQLRAYGAYSPFVSADDFDTHVYTETEYEETFSGGSFYGFGLACSWRAWKNLFITLAYDYQNVPEIQGDMTYRSPDGQGTIADNAGLKNTFSMYSFRVGYTF